MTRQEIILPEMHRPVYIAFSFCIQSVIGECRSVIIMLIAKMALTRSENDWTYISPFWSSLSNYIFIIIISNIPVLMRGKRKGYKLDKIIMMTLGVLGGTS